MLSLGIITPTGLMPELVLGVDYKLTRTDIAKPLTAPILALFKAIQVAVGEAANLFGMPGGITVDGVIGPVTGEAIKFTIGKLTDDLRGDVSPEARDGQPAGIAKDARNVLGVLQEAIARKSSAPVAATPIKPTPQPFILPTVQVKAPVQPTPTPQPFVLTPTDARAPLAPVALLPVSTTAAKPGLSTAAAFLLAAVVVAVLVARR